MEFLKKIDPLPQIRIELNQMRKHLTTVFFTICCAAPCYGAIKPSQNPKVLRWIKIFQKNDDAYFNNWLVKSKKKLPKIKLLLKKQGLPTDLAYLAIIESGLNPKAVSSAKATGYWQFMKPTALQYGLHINWWLDERRDLIKSTWAAGRYLSALYGMFNSWHLALSAYNMGENRLKKLMQKHKTRNFWSLSEKKGFPKETKEYIPKFLAATLIAKNPKHYGFNITRSLKPYSYTYQFVPGGTDLIQIAQQLDISPLEIKKLNPELKRALIPKEISSHRIRVPNDFRRRVALYFTKNIR